MARATKTAAELDAYSIECIEGARGALKKNFSNVPWVPVTLPLNAQEDKLEYQYIEVTHNGTMYTIVRGEEVGIPVPLFLILANSPKWAPYVLGGTSGAARHLRDSSAEALIRAATEDVS